MDQIFSNTYLWAQIVGLFAMTGCISIWQLKNPRHIIILYIPVAILWGIQYYLLGAMVGVMICTLSIAKDACVGFMPARYSRYFVITFLATITTVTLYIAKTPLDYLPLLASTLFNLGLLMPDNRSLVARFAVISQLSWLLYNVPTEAWMGVACCVLVITSSLISMARYEKWQLGKCFKTFPPSFIKSIFALPNFRTYP